MRFRRAETEWQEFLPAKNNGDFALKARFLESNRAQI